MLDHARSRASDVAPTAITIDAANADPLAPALGLHLPPTTGRFPSFDASSLRVFTVVDPSDSDALDILTALIEVNHGVSVTIGVEVDHQLPNIDHQRIETVDIESVSGTFLAYLDLDQSGGGSNLVDAADAGLPIITSDRPASAMFTHGVDALLVDASVAGYSWGLRHLAAQPHAATRIGLAARRVVAAATWEPLDALIDDLTTKQQRKRVAIINTFAVDAPVNGGQRRLRQLAGQLARVADVELFVLSQHASALTERILAPGLIQIEVPRSDEQKQAEQKIFGIVGEPTDDMTVADLAATTPAWASILTDRLASVDLIVSCHPYLAPTIPPLGDIGFVYDSYNAEASFKRSILADDVNGRWFLEATERAERNATMRSDLIVACTQNDLDEIRSLDPAHHDGVVVSNGVDTDALPFATAEQRTRARWELLDLAGVDAFSNRPIATFIGSSHAPNLSAAELLIAAAEQRPNWVFLLAGSHSSVFAEQKRSLPTNVTLVPVFDEGLLWPLIAGADAATNPMVSGGGSNLKIFDYLAVGSPVLATPTGARGLDDPASLVELTEPTVAGIVAGLDHLIDPELAPIRNQRALAGRSFVESEVSWQTLGAKWSGALGELLGGWTGQRRPQLGTSRPIILLDAPPLASDPVIAAMQRVRSAAADGTPTSREITVDPAFREHIRKAKANRNVGRELPDDARMALPKKALIRAGHALSNEQVVYNEASLDAMQRLMDVINDLRRDQFALTERLEAAEAALANRGDTRPTSINAPDPVPTVSTSSGTTDSSPALDAFYEAFEDSFRGDPTDVASSTAHYLDRVADAPDGPAIDVGCGRGEWLGLIAGTGRRALGFDTNTVAIERCRAAGLDATHGDGIAHLESVTPASIAVVSAFHVIEHLEFDQLHRFVLAAHRALLPGGKLVLETPNCLNLQVGASSFWLDPTHRSPVHPEQLRFLLSHAGFGAVDVFGLHPDEGSTPTDLDPDPARNGLLTEFHRLVFGSVDLAAIATKS